MKNNSISTCHACGKSRVCVYTLDEFYCWECAGRMLQIAVEIGEDMELTGLGDYVKGAVKATNNRISPEARWYINEMKRRKGNDATKPATTV